MNTPTKTKNNKFEPVDTVNPDIGGMSHLLVPTLPLVHLPNSMVRISRQPQGYNQEKITHFPINIISHRMAAAGRIMVTTGEINTNPDTWSSTYDHDFETTKPYHYSVLLEDHNIDLELTTTEHTVFYQFKGNSNNKINLYLQTINNGKIEFSPDEKTIRGVEIVSGVKIHFCMKIQGEVEKYGAFLAEQRFDDKLNVEGKPAGLYLTISTSDDHAVQLKVGISYISPEQAAKHLEKEIPDWDFESILPQNKNVWNQALRKIKVEGGSDDEKTAFYTLFIAVMSAWLIYQRMANTIAATMKPSMMMVEVTFM